MRGQCFAVDRPWNRMMRDRFSELMLDRGERSRQFTRLVDYGEKVS